MTKLEQLQGLIVSIEDTEVFRIASLMLDLCKLDELKFFIHGVRLGMRSSSAQYGDYEIMGKLLKILL